MKIGENILNMCNINYMLFHSHSNYVNLVLTPFYGIEKQKVKQFFSSHPGSNGSQYSKAINVIGMEIQSWEDWVSSSGNSAIGN